MSSFDVLPAIDLTRGRLGRFTPRGPVPVEAFGGEPLAAVGAFVAAGARWIHVVDMDLAFEGVARNLSVIGEVASLGVRVQASGGAATQRDLDALLSAGATRAVLGAAALADPGLVATLTAALGDGLVVGVETDGERIRPRGAATVELPLDETLRWLADSGAARLLLTSVPRVGALSGPDLEGVRAAVGTGLPVLAAGGIASPADLVAVRTSGAVGAVVGRAAHEDGGLQALLAEAGR